MKIKNGLFADNQATGDYYSLGGALYLADVGTSLINCTFTENEATYRGGAVYNKFSTLEVTNDILWDDTPQEIYLESGTVNATYSDIEGGMAGTGNIDIYPQFYNTAEGDYSLGELSPCRDTGTPDTTGLTVSPTCLTIRASVMEGSTWELMNIMSDCFSICRFFLKVPLTVQP